mmetsp:Transcript_6244/g.11098  ORF Transcript_6244/g.11098 Transcript_6244/m.11098 type:complete len:217 (+) Transcript_6244:1321-1971(+)
MRRKSDLKCGHRPLAIKIITARRYELLFHMSLIDEASVKSRRENIRVTSPATWNWMFTTTPTVKRFAAKNIAVHNMIDSGMRNFAKVGTVGCALSEDSRRSIKVTWLPLDLKSPLFKREKAIRMSSCLRRRCTGNIIATTAMVPAPSPTPAHAIPEAASTVSSGFSTVKLKGIPLHSSLAELMAKLMYCCAFVLPEIATRALTILLKYSVRSPLVS